MNKLKQTFEAMPQETLHAAGMDPLTAIDKEWRIKDSEGRLLAVFYNRAMYDFFVLASEEQQTKEGE